MKPPELSNDDQFIRGAWHCEQCDFTLQKSFLSGKTGDISANTSPLNNICPNDGSLMKPLAWRKVNADMLEIIGKQRQEINDLKRLVETLNKASK